MNKKYILKDGLFLNKADNETVNSISGKLVGIRTLSPEDSAKKLQLDFKEEADDGQETVHTLTLSLYNDPALKILRCLYGIAEIIADKVVTISMEEREGQKSLLHVSADGEELPVLGYVEQYAYDRRLFTDKTYGVLKRCLEFSQRILVYANADGVYPSDYSGALDIDEVCSYIREMRRLGRTGELTVKKTSFTIPAAAKGYLKALGDLSGTRAFRYTCDEAEIDRIWGAYTEELPEQPDATNGLSGDEEAPEGDEEA